MLRLEKSFSISKRFILFLMASVFFGSTVIYSYSALASPLPYAIISVITPAEASPKTINIPWPSQGQGALGSLTEGVLTQSTKDETQKPIASITKVITSLAVLEKKPIAANEEGPNISLTQADVEIYKYYVNAGGSTARVETGEIMSERQMLEGLLLPSANNLADSLAIWAFGSLDEYTNYANTMLKSWGIERTNVRDASGFSDETISTASDLVRIGQKALDHPVLAEIVQKKQTTLPVIGLVQNTNMLLNNGGTGIKTGHTDAAGACLLFATTYVVNNENITIIGSLIGQSQMTAVFQSASQILSASKEGFIERTIVKKGERIARYTSAWGTQSNVIATESLLYTGWYDTPLSASIIVFPKKLARIDEEAGIVAIRAHNKNISVPAVTDKSIDKPSVFWRIMHGLSL